MEDPRLVVAVAGGLAALAAGALGVATSTPVLGVVAGVAGVIAAVGGVALRRGPPQQRPARRGRGRAPHHAPRARVDQRRPAGGVHSPPPRSSSARRELTRERNEHAFDPATGLYDERYFAVLVQQHVAAARRSLRPVSVVIFEIDSMGEADADTRQQALGVVGDVVRRTLRESDAACRLGDLMIGAILEDTPEAGAVWAAERVRGTLLASPIGDALTLSAGVACSHPHARCRRARAPVELPRSTKRVPRPRPRRARTRSQLARAREEVGGFHDRRRDNVGLGEQRQVIASSTSTGQPCSRAAVVSGAYAALNCTNTAGGAGTSGITSSITATGTAGQPRTNSARRSSSGISSRIRSSPHHCDQGRELPVDRARLSAASTNCSGTVCDQLRPGCGSNASSSTRPTTPARSAASAGRAGPAPLCPTSTTGASITVVGAVHLDAPALVAQARARSSTTRTVR